MKKLSDANTSSNDEGDDSFLQHRKNSKLNTASTLQEKTNLSKISNNELEEQRSLIDNGMRFGNQPEYFGRSGNDTTSQSSRSQINSISGYNRPITPPSDVQFVISQIKDPKDIIAAIDGYKVRSKNLDKDEIMKQENSKIKRYKNCLYFGQIINGKRHGKGFMVYQDSRVYEGEWENDSKHGKGLEICPNGNQYDGFFLNGKPEGVGVFSWSNGESYEGEWRNGMKHGSGIWRGTKGETYIGEWKYGKADGHGVHVWRNGDRYEGELKNCLKHGHGTERFANGDFYVGNYVNGKPDGYGEYVWANGCQYKGFFRNGLRYGKGVWRKGPGNADKYEGEWVNDKKCGHGMYSWASGNIYKGNYFDDLRHGYGEMIWTDGSMYKGQWERGIQNGEGELSVPGKPTKIGLFQNNIFVGELSEKVEDMRSFMETSTDGIKPRKLSPLLRKAGDESQLLKKENKRKDLSFDSNYGSPQDTSFQSDSIQRAYAMKASNQLAPIEPRGRSGMTKAIRLTSSSQKKRLNLPSLNSQNSQSADAKETMPPAGGWLTPQEIAKWSVVREKLGVDPKKYDNLNDEKVIEKIRELIHPKVWRYWPKGHSVQGRSDFQAQQTNKIALRSFDMVH